MFPCMWDCGCICLDSFLCLFYDSIKLGVQVYFESDEVQAAIVTCGGLCPGLNTVIRELVCGLYHMYGVKKVLGISVSESSNILILSEDIRMNVKKCSQLFFFLLVYWSVKLK
jgi:hypothetical protein